MTTTTTSNPSDRIRTPGRGRRTAFRAVAVVLALGMGLTGGHLLVTGWTDPLDGGIHRLQDLHWGIGEGLLIAVAMAWQIRRPERRAGAMRVAVLAVLAQLVGAAAALVVDPFGLVVLLLVGVALALHPARRDVLRPVVSPDRRLLVAAAPAALALVIFAGLQIAHHYSAAAGDPLEARTGWLGAAFSGLALALTVVAAPLLRSAETAFLAAAGLTVLGVASLLHPYDASSFGVAGGAWALVLAVALVVARGTTWQREQRQGAAHQ